MLKYLIGLDNGGTYIKAVIFDTNGKEIAKSHRQTELSYPVSGWVERDMEALWQANCAVLREVIVASGIDPSELAGLSISGHGKGVYLWGSNGSAAYPGILSSDSRADYIARRWNEDGTAERIHAITHQKIIACQPVCLLKWFQENNPDALNRTKWIFGVKDYIRYLLTGEANAELTDFSGSNLINLNTRRYDNELLELFELQDIEGKLPPIKSSCDHCGCITATVAQMTGLPIGLPVAAGMFDIDACAIAMDITDDKRLCVIAGTWGIHEYLSPAPVDNDHSILNSAYCLPGYYLVEDSSATSASNNEWFVDTFMQSEKQRAKLAGENIYKQMDEMAASVTPSQHNIYFFPYIYGSNYNPKAKAALVGMSAENTTAHIARAVLEGIVMCHLVHVKKLLTTRKNPPLAIRLSGGVTNSEVWMQIYADIFDMPVEIVETKELGAWGAAMAAGVAAGIYPSLQETAGRLVNIARVLQPDPKKAALYKQKFEHYQHISQLINSLY